MKPFDLEAAKRGDPIVTRNGVRAKYLCCAEDNIAYPLVALVQGHISPIAYTKKGEVFADEQGVNDLFMLPKTRVIWVNLYQRGHHYAYDSQAIADNHATPARIGPARRVEIEE